MRLPEKFTAEMKSLLADEWVPFYQAWEEGVPYQGLRVNTLKISCADFLARTGFALKPVPWTTDGFYLCGEERPAKHPYYQAGIYYLQEPSAMSPAACLGVKPGDKVLDLCAAPGGKSTQLAAALQGKGLLVSNDNSAERVKALVWNLEHWGATNAVVTNEEPARLAEVFPAFFDKILVDAPCSGEGMFRKDPRAVKSWSTYNSELCSAMQKDILAQAVRMLKPGGRIVYSTCTFSVRENEEVMAHFLAEHPDFVLGDLPLDFGWEAGFLVSGRTDKTRRLWPHKVKGEGHFLAMLEQTQTQHQLQTEQQEPQAQEQQPQPQQQPRTLQTRAQKQKDAFMAEAVPEAVASFLAENLFAPPEGTFRQMGQYVYLVPAELPELTGLKVMRYGWFVGTMDKGRFTPSQALAMGLKSSNAKRRVSLSLSGPEVAKYLKGETLLGEGEKGWTLVCLEEFPLGWAKQTGDYLKNYYPPGWRLT
ncbi:MAG: RsmF rRNA methyltransferase first C-terminal domain-containing protein [Peptococcia bacterium]|jgi:NOL1/NOP2/sun family putative RNA methylase